VGGGRVSFLKGSNLAGMCAAGESGDSIGSIILYPAW